MIMSAQKNYLGGITRFAAAAARMGTDLPAYFYDCDAAVSHCRDLSSLLEHHFDGYETAFLLPLFANPCFPFLDQLVESSPSAGLLVNSIPELTTAKRYSWLRMPRIAFAGGVLPDDAVTEIVRAADLFYACSLREFETASRSSKCRAELGLRLDLSGRGDSRGTILSALLEFLQSHVHLKGRIRAIHAYLGPAAISYAACLTHAHAMLEAVGEFPELREINFSGGWPFDYKEYASPLPSQRPDLVAYLRELSNLIGAARAGSVRRLVWEPGKALLAPHGYFACRVIDVVPTSLRFVDVHLDASFTHLPALKLKGRQHAVTLLRPDYSQSAESPAFCRLRGCTGLSTDLLMPEALHIARPAPGDILVIHDVGAYGWAGSYNFLGLQRPSEYLLGSGSLTCVRQRQPIDHLLDGLVAKHDTWPVVPFT